MGIFKFVEAAGELDIGMAIIGVGLVTGAAEGICIAGSIETGRTGTVANGAVGSGSAAEGICIFESIGTATIGTVAKGSEEPGIAGIVDVAGIADVEGIVVIAGIAGIAGIAIEVLLSP